MATSASPSDKRSGHAGGWPDRPDGPLVWFHVPREGALGPVEQLITRLEQKHRGLRFLITTPSTPVTPLNWPTYYQRAPEDRRSSVVAFLDHWKPDMVLWSRGFVTPHLVQEISQRDLPLFLIDADLSGFDGRAGLIKAWRTKSMLRRFNRVLTINDETAQKLQAMGMWAWQVEVSGALEEGTAALPYDEDDRRELADALSTRPVWVAMHVPPQEVDLVLHAHQVALRRAHRFLLILRPTQDHDARSIVQAARAGGCNPVLRSEVYVPGPDDHVLVADLPEERGLWYRTAPLTFLGGTFSNQPSRNPFEAAALGSAILHGPEIRRFRSSFERLSQAGGARLLQRPEQLGPALGDLASPDRAAKLAHSAWDICSSGAEVTDRVMQLIESSLPASEVA